MDLVRLGQALVVLCLLKQAVPEPTRHKALSLNHIANVSYADESLSGIAAIFSPRMDFDQWKPLTGRGDPLRNDPTYDYEPPVLERVRYWADETRYERDHYPERKSEVLMLGVSSRKPSVALRHPPPRKHHRPILPNKYEDYSYKLSERYPMTILVPPPLPPPGHKSSLFVLDEERLPNAHTETQFTDAPKLTMETTTLPEHHTSLYDLQESNLIYQSSSVTPNWFLEPLNQTKSIANSAVSSDYAGWGPTTPTEDASTANETHNFISNDYLNAPNHPYSFYKPILSEAPPPPQATLNPLLLPTFVPTVLPPLSSSARSTTTSTTPPQLPVTWPTEQTTTEASTFYQEYYDDTTTDTNLQSTQESFLTHNTFDMLNPMLSMPLGNGPERPEDNLYAHASENLHVFREHFADDTTKLETMQNMQPPPVTMPETTATSAKNPVHVSNYNNVPYKKPTNNLDPYLHMRFTTPVHADDTIEKTRPTTERPSVPKYLIIQGHSKVKTYGSKPKIVDESDTINNEIIKSKEISEVKHLHSKKGKSIQKSEKVDMSRRGKAQNLNSLLHEGRGSIEIQETDIGIKYDVSDGSEVPIEIYRKGIVDNDENDYSHSKKSLKSNRTKRQVDLEDILPFDEDTLEEFVYNFLKDKRNDTGITGLLAQAVTSNAASVIDELDEEEDEDNGEENAAHEAT